ncbi:GumC family protein [Rhodalgimonas zhirmunskyi]|uniref:Chain-length determining protein n=1 Tax=Rhodalgimonas zhirmunskyi TaxID=2964767 RepID=A0AAJ1UC25_9RHOB|nr:chain-length determining protein [Rhodoalgimonas zhirmunskyi]MDQ2093162.1 chain-length determining protein [Rhodoalgimonas zhirmunskyi]
MGQIQSLGDFLGMLRRRLWLIVAIVIAGVAFTIWWTLGQARIYEATAVAQIESPTIAATNTPPTTQSNGIEQRLRIFEQKLMARDNIIAMVRKYDLYAGTGFSIERKVAALRESTRITQLTDPNAAFGQARVPTGLLITVSDSVPEVAAAMANDFLMQLVDLNRQRRSVAAEETLEFYKAEAARVEGQMSALETRIATFKEQNAPYLPEGVAAQRDELQTLKSTLLEIEQSLIELEATRTRQRAEVIERQSNLLREQQALIQKRIDEINGAIAAAPEVDRQFGILTRKLEQLQGQFSVINRQATEAEMGQLLTSQDQFERIEVLETALVPENPISGSRKKKVLLGGFLSGILGVGLAFLLETMNPVIRTPAQLERALDVKAVVAIPTLTTKGTRRNKRLFWMALLAAVLAALFAGWSLVKDLAQTVIDLVSRRTGQA